MAGGASQEVSVQRQRENRILEAVYPRPSAIPERYVNILFTFWHQPVT